MINLEVDGNKLSNFVDISVTRSLDSFVGTFRFSATSVPNQQDDFPIRPGNKVEITADDNLIMTGFVESISVSYNSKSHIINIQGRDITGDVLDSTFGGEGLNFGNSAISLKKITEIVLESSNFRGFFGFGIFGGIDVIVNTDIDDFDIGDVVDAKTGQTLYSYLEQYSRKRQVLMTTDEEGNIVYERSSGDKLDVDLLNLVNNDTNNILSATASLKTNELFNQYVCRSQGNLLTGNKTGKQSEDEVVAAVSDGVEDDAVRDTRIFNFTAENASSTEQCTNRAEWQKTINRAKAFKYTCVVQGHSHNDDEVWRLNRLVNIEDVFVDINDRFLINAITWNQSLTGGSTTTLEFVQKNAYLLPTDDKQRLTSDGFFGFFERDRIFGIF